MSLWRALQDDHAERSYLIRVHQSAALRTQILCEEFRQLSQVSLVNSLFPVQSPLAAANPIGSVSALIATHPNNHSHATQQAIVQQVLNSSTAFSSATLSSESQTVSDTPSAFFPQSESLDPNFSLANMCYTLAWLQRTIAEMCSRQQKLSNSMLPTFSPRVHFHPNGIASKISIDSQLPIDFTITPESILSKLFSNKQFNKVRLHILVEFPLSHPFKLLAGVISAASWC